MPQITLDHAFSWLNFNCTERLGLRWQRGPYSSDLRSEQNSELLNQRVVVHNAWMLHQPVSLDRSELNGNHVTILIIKPATYAKRAEMGIQLIRGDNNARPRFPAF
jgi:hypothetical protein